MIATDSLHTSELSFIDRRDQPAAAPTEWDPFTILLPLQFDSLERISVRVNDRPAATAIKLVQGAPRIVAEWVRAGPGWYDIEVDDGVSRVIHRIRIDSAKVTYEANEQLLLDLDERLPVAIAIALRNAGAVIGVRAIDPKQQTIESELARIRRAVRGDGRFGLAHVLRRLARDPHQMLINQGEWVPYRNARRPDPTKLVQGLWKLGNIEDGHLRQVIDRRVVHTVDLYENRLVKAFAVELEWRLRLLAAVLAETSHGDVRAEVDELLNEMVSARRTASFLEDVGELRTSPSRATMVLMKRFEYRAAYEAFLEFRKNQSVHLEDVAITEPLRELPYLYQLWCTLELIRVVVSFASEFGWRVSRQRVVTPRAHGLYVRVLRDGLPAVVMQDETGRTLRIIPERTYSKSSGVLRSVSFNQVPDIALELDRGQQREVMLFDPKYKLVSEDLDDGVSGRPTKTDIDKMHAYRDAIRDRSGRHVVRHAAIMYPGESVAYEGGVSAIRAYPGETTALGRSVHALLTNWLGQSSRHR